MQPPYVTIWTGFTYDSAETKKQRATHQALYDAFAAYGKEHVYPTEDWTLGESANFSMDVPLDRAPGAFRDLLAAGISITNIHVVVNNAPDVTSDLVGLIFDVANAHEIAIEWDVAPKV